MSAKTKQMITQQSVLHSTVLLTASSLLLQGLGFLYRILLSRLLTSEQMGVYGLLMPVYAVINAGTLSGFSLAASRTAANRTDASRSPITHGGTVLLAALRMYLPIFLMICTAIAPTSGILAKLIGDAGLRTAILLLFPCLLMTAFENILKSVFQGLKNVTPSMLSECCEQVVRIVSVGAFLYIADAKHLSGASACVLIVLGMIVSEIASDLILGGFAVGLFRAGRSDAATEREVLRVALPVSAGNACGMLLSGISAAIIPAALQRYGASVGQAMADYGELSGMLLPLLAIPGAFVYPIFTVMLPRLTEAFSGKDEKRFNRLAGCMFCGALSIGLCLEGAAVILAPKLCTLFFGKAYPAGSGQLLTLGLTTFLSFAVSAAACVLNAAGKQKTLVTVGLILGAAEIPLLYTAMAVKGLGGYAGVSLLLTAVQAIWLGMSCFGHIKSKTGKDTIS